MSVCRVISTGNHNTSGRVKGFRLPFEARSDGCVDKVYADCRSRVAYKLSQPRQVINIGCFGVLWTQSLVQWKIAEFVLRENSFNNLRIVPGLAVVRRRGKQGHAGAGWRWVHGV